MKAAPPAAPLASEVLARAGGENFPVTSRLFPRDVRRDLLRIYGFARLCDDIGDEVPGDRLASLDRLASELHEIFTGGEPTHPLLRDLARTVRWRSLPPEPFDRLIEANRRDQSVNRYATFEELRAYCALSANPVGELVLRVCGVWTPRRGELSDEVCTGLQLVEFWQDLGEDVAKGRLYVPVEDLERFGVAPDEFPRGVVGERFGALMRFEAERTRALLLAGRALSRDLGGRVGFAVRLFTAGGLAALDDLRRRGFQTFRTSASASRARRAWTSARELVRT